MHSSELITRHRIPHRIRLEYLNTFSNKMSLLFSELNRSDAVRENLTDSGFNNSSSYCSRSSPSSQSAGPSRRAMLRQLNQTFKQQLSEVDVCLRGASQKYDQVNFLRTCESALLPNHAGTQEQLIGRKKSEQHLWDEYEEGSLPQSSYQEAIQKQEYLQSQLLAITKLLGQRAKFVPTALQKAEQHSPINWELLIRQQDHRTHRELLKTSFVNQEKEARQWTSKQGEDYIAYTEESSTHQLPPEQKKRKDEPPKAECMIGGRQGRGGSNAKVRESSRGKINRDIQARIINSPCTIGKILHSNSASQIKQLLSRLTKEKNQREQLLANIKFNIM